MDHPSQTKRQIFVISQLHKINDIKKLAEFSPEDALEKALQMQERAARNYAPYKVWMDSINNLIHELKK